MSWTPATTKEVKKLVEKDLVICDDAQGEAFKRFRVEPYYASLQRYGKSEQVVVVARKSSEVIYYEDVEEGFNVSRLAPDGSILEHWCNQDSLGEALNYWIAGRTPEGKWSPAQNIKPK